MTELTQLEKEAKEFEYVDMGFLEFIEVCQASPVTKLEEILMILTIEHSDLEKVFNGYGALLIDMQEKGTFDYLNDETSAALIGSMGCALFYLRRMEEQQVLIKKIMYDKTPDCFKQ